MCATNEMKLGLALSGGGFRSALFHVGVLARLAELDLLRKIDVISSVSGGSILAAYYYLKVKALLEKQSRDGREAPGRDAYIRLVGEIETDFLAAVQKNMLLRSFLDPGKNVRMLATEYTRTERLAELLNNYFFKPIFPGPHAKQNYIPLKDLPIRPKAANLLPDSRVPKLVLNATSLNTGHLWQFTSDAVGEKCTEYEAGQNIEFFKQFQMYDDRLTMGQRKVLYHISLGQAVAASCCVPGIFDPLEIRNLYKSAGKPVNVRLVDGGLVDNQGLTSLFVENCTHIICSDASDILQPDRDPSAQFLNVALRANDILIDRIRSKSIIELFKYGSGKYVLFDMGDQKTRGTIFPADSEKIVRALTRIRTDLDAFTDREADSLMYYGYRLSHMILKNAGFELVREMLPVTRNWRFLGIREGFLTDPGGRNELLHHLEVGSRQMFKVFLLKKAVPYAILLPIPFIIGLLTLYMIIRISPMIFWGLVIFSALGLVYSQNQRILKLMDNVAVLRGSKERILKTLISLRLPEPFSYIVALASWIQLVVFDRLFLSYGRLRKPSGEKQVSSEK